MSENLMTALLNEIERNVKLISLYKSVPTGFYAAAMFQQDINAAKEAIAENDINKMLSAYQTLKENKE